MELLLIVLILLFILGGVSLHSLLYLVAAVLLIVLVFRFVPKSPR